MLTIESTLGESEVLADSKHSALKDAVVQYGLSLASGLASFLALKLMQHTVSDSARYSQLSTILLSFTTFQIITDFGTQTEFIRNYRSADKARRHSVKMVLFQSRLALGLVALIVSFIYSVSAGFGSEMTQAFLLFQLSLVPFAVMTTSDTIFIAEEKFSKVVFARLSRILAIGAFLLPTLLPRETSLYLPVISFTLTLFFCSVLTWKLSLSKSLNQNTRTLFSLFNMPSSSQDTRSSFFLGSLIAASVIAFQLTQGLVAQAFLVREVGEISMTSFNTSIAIATPAILAFQTLSQLEMPRVANWTTLNNSVVKEQFYRYALKLITIFTVMICGLWMTEQIGMVRWFFPFSNIEVIKLSSMLILCHALLNLCNPTIALCQYRKNVRPFFLTLVTALPLSWICQYFLSRIWPEAALLVGLIVFALTIAASSYAAAGLVKREHV